MENQNNNHKKGLQFLEFHKIRKTKDGKNVLIFINDNVCFSVSVKYLEKVIATQKSEEPRAS
jgi:hypothetical protein